MKKVKSEPGTIVFKSKKRHVSFAFGIGKRWGINFGAEYYEAWDWHHFVIEFTIIKFFVAQKADWQKPIATDKSCGKTKQCLFK